MKKAIAICLALTLLLLAMPAALATSPVPDTLPDDLGGKTLYGYLMELKNQFMPAKVFADPVRYSDEDRENARRAARLLIDATSVKMTEAGKGDQYNLYLRAYAYDLLFQDTGDPTSKEQGLADYLHTVELGGAYAQADHDRLLALTVKAAPLAWQVPQMLTVEEMGSILNIPAGNLLLLGTPYALADGSRTGAGYTLASVHDPAATAIYVLADPLGGKARYNTLRASAFLQRATEITDLGDEAVLMGLRNMDHDPTLYLTVLARKDEVVLQVRVPYAVWHGPGFNADPAAIARQVMQALLANLYDTARPVPAMGGADMLQLTHGVSMDMGNPVSAVPDTLPADLGGKTEYGFLVDIRQAYLPVGVLTDPARTEQERNDARRAIRLLTNIITAHFDTLGPNPYELEIRGACYAEAYADTGIAALRMLAINDYKQAIASGFTAVKAAYDRLAAPLLAPMAELPSGAKGGLVATLQQWLAQAGYNAPQNAVLGSATVKAIKAFEKANGLTADGIADIAFLLSLYGKIDDGDEPLPGA
jgi:hypothetical protein